MATLTKDTPRIFLHVGDPHEIDVPVLTATTIYKGAAVGVTAAGYARPLVAGDQFAGFCVLGVDNTGASGACNVRVHGRTRVKLTVEGASDATFSDVLYASDDNTFTTTASTNTAIGRLEVSLDGSTSVHAYCESLSLRN